MKGGSPRRQTDETERTGTHARAGDSEMRRAGSIGWLRPLASVGAQGGWDRIGADRRRSAAQRANGTRRARLSSLHAPQYPRWSALRLPAQQRAGASRPVLVMAA